MDRFFQNLVNIFKNVEKSFIIYFAWERLDFFENLVVILKSLN